MLKELIGFWSGQDTLSELFRKLGEMIETAKVMYIKAAETLNDGEHNLGEVQNELYKMDGKLNTLQQTIRRDIVIHLSVQGNADILPCLMLMSLVKDAERLGDYCKNVLEISQHFDGYSRDPYYASLMTMSRNILAWFDEAKASLDVADKESAQKMVEKAYQYSKQCDQAVWELVGGSESVNAPAMALQFRFFKRIIAHLGNIMTAIIMPLDKLDYYDEKVLEKGD